MANVTVTIRTFDDQGVPAPIDGTLVRIFDAAGTSFITDALTGTVTPGEIQFTLFANAGGVGYVVDLSKSGVSFVGGPRYSITAFDPPGGGANIFQYTGHVGLQGMPVKFLVQDDTPLPIEDFRLRLFDAGDSFLTEVDTDVNGEVDMILEGVPDPGTEYIVRLFKSGWIVDLGPTQKIAVKDPLVLPETNIFEFLATQPSTKETTDPNMCLLSGYLVDSALRPRQNVRVEFIAMPIELDAMVSGFDAYSDPNIVRNLIISEGASFYTDKNGYVEVLLPRASIYQVRVIGLELPGSTGGTERLELVYVPDAAGAKLEDVLYPYVASVAYNPAVISIDVDEVIEVELTVTGSNQQPIEGVQALDCLLDFTLADPSIANIRLMQEGSKLELTGLVAGNTTIEVSRIAGTWAPRVPPISALVVTPATVEVLP
jgi:hypothetical protein